MKMKNLTITILMACVAVTALISPVQAEIVTIDEAMTVAKNWVTTIIHHEGDWGGSKSAAVEEVKEFKRGKRVVGYFCRVKPKGYIVVSLRKELAPVKAYSATGYLEPESEEGPAEVIKADMEHPLNAIEKELGPIKSVRTEDVQRILKVNHRSAWEKLEPDVQAFKAGLESGAITMEYDPGTWLLTTNWHQGWPYNKKCPDLGCSDWRLNGHAWVGCTATAAAQIMRYWSWPPGYDWLNMPDSVTGGSPEDEIDAVATLSHNAGAAAGMLYTCDWSFLLPAMMSAAMRNSFVYNADDDAGWDNSQASWHEIMKGQINNNQPLLYGNTGESHSYVVDGWKIVGSNILWHINYGWRDTGSDTWYSRDYIPVTDVMVKNITPGPSLGSVLSGTYLPPSSPFRYFDQDCANYYLSTTTFGAGQNLQFLPGVKLTCGSPLPGVFIRFEGTSSENTRLFSIKGTQSAGIKIYNGAIELYPGGGLRFLSRQVVTD